jgi:hypothetical protein
MCVLSFGVLIGAREPLRVTSRPDFQAAQLSAWKKVRNVKSKAERLL